MAVLPSSLPWSSPSSSTTLAARPRDNHSIFKSLSRFGQYGNLVGRGTVAFSSVSASTNLYSSLQKHMIQTAATIASSFTLIATIITFYWFCRMEKRLRHKLIMLSIFGCFVRGLWYFIFSLIVMRTTMVESKSAVCQASGFFISLGNEITDFATLFIAIHGALQIFKPTITAFEAKDGIHNYQRQVYAVIIVVPLLLSALPFVNPADAYTAQGAFCALPTKPIWYRLTFAYIPRYIIGLTVIGLSLGVYMHVELRFRSFQATSKRASRTSVSDPPTAKRSIISMLSSNTKKTKSNEDLPAPPKRPAPILLLPTFGQKSSTVLNPSPALQSPKEVRIHVDDPDTTEKEYFPSNFSSDRKHSSATASTKATSASGASLSIPGLPWLKHHRGSVVSGPELEAPPSTPNNEVTATFEQQNDIERRALKRQLRLIFVYPIVYVLLWIPSIILNGLQFSSKWATHIPSWLAILSTLSLTLMGGIDCVVFLWREKPWQQTRSGGPIVSILRHCSKGSSDPEANAAGTSIEPANRIESKDMEPSSSIPDTANLPPCGEDVVKALSEVKISKPKPGSLGRTRTSSSGKHSSVRSRAYERLALEKEDRREVARESVGTGTTGTTGGSAGSKSSGTNPGGVGPREWWDRKDSSAVL